MFADVCKDFESITKADLSGFFTDMASFLTDDYPSVYNYFAGKSETIQNDALSTLNNLLSTSRNILRLFQTFSSKFSNVGFWELESYCQDLNDTLEKIAKTPKYSRTSKSVRGHKHYIQADASIGDMRTVEDVADELQENYEDIVLNNDLEEKDYEIDELRFIKAFVNNETNVVVQSILEYPVGKKVYGRDIQRKIAFENNDLKLVEYVNNVEQKCDILLTLEKGDIPEFPAMGLQRSYGITQNSYNYAEMVTDLQETFLQNDLFNTVSLEDLDINNGDITVTVDIRTKYKYETTKTFVI